jgi:galactokinase
MTIDRSTWIAARPREDQQVHVHSLNIGTGSIFGLDTIVHDSDTPWTNYIRGVAKTLQTEGYSLQGFDGLVESTVPISSGLSSSAALEVATVIIFELMSDWELESVQKALLTQRAENEFVGVNCGILDQFTSANGQAGHAMILDCRDLSHEMTAIHPDISVVICDTKTKRELTGSEYSQRRAQCEEGASVLARIHPTVKTLRDVSLAQLTQQQDALSSVVFRRSRFIIEESARVLALAKALPLKDHVQINKLTEASYFGARDLYEIAVPEMEAMYQSMTAGPGVIGARQACAGFGGCMVAFVERDAKKDFAEHIEKTYSAATGLQPKVYPVNAAAGASPLK